MPRIPPLQAVLCLLVAQVVLGEESTQIETASSRPTTLPAVTMSVGNERPMPYTEVKWDSKRHGDLQFVGVRNDRGKPAFILASGDGTRMVIRGSIKAFELRGGAINIVTATTAPDILKPVVATPLTTQPAPDSGVRMAIMRTQHYQMMVQGQAIDPAQLAAIVERLYARLKAFFGTEPHEAEPLRLMVFDSYRDYARFIRSVVAAGDGNLDGPIQSRGPVEPTGTYLQWIRTAVVVGGLGPCRTRDSVIRQCFTQFLYTAKDLNFAPSSDYYTSGLAQYFALHSWDGHVTRFATIPDVYWFDAPGEAREMFDLPPYKHSLRALATSPTKISRQPQDGVRACGWGLVSFLLDRHAKEYKIWSDSLEHLVDPAIAWDKAFSSASDGALSNEYAEWLAKHQMSWCGMEGDWQNTDPGTFEGYSIPGPLFGVAACATKTACKEITAQTEFGRSASPGVVICCQTSVDYTTVRITPRGELLMKRHANNISFPDELIGHIAPPGAGKITLSAKWENKKVSVSIDGKVVFAKPDPQKGQLGLAVSDGAATFTNVEIR